MKKIFGSLSAPPVTSDQSKPNANEPPPDTGGDELGTPDMNKNDCIYLSKDMLDQAGLTDVEPGQMFTLTITGKTTNIGDDGKVEADITDASMGEVQHGGDQPGGSENDQESSDEDSFQRPKGGIEMSPKGMKGF